ncbi:signal transduction histidine kinase [Natronocella acetinitrilica]|uniref:histidine kinase n=1 Tax=Natronocella acetinitrilica TaxID=414046 RepID=A0AAE3KBB5_9GAMM|nr:hybrid sensor histidine kinase/response regulator [Natronocella acetinitrilica]MCP1674614.1 signal transduction histidine kinase [Natronocella acetinitrilica]
MRPDEGSAHHPQRRRETGILLVDDEELAHKYFGMYFRMYYRVFGAGSAEEALALLAERGEEIGVIISDQRMPGMSGVELLEQTRRLYPNIERLLATAYMDIDAAVDAVNRGEVRAFLPKPWRMEEIEAPIAQAVDHYLERQDELAVMQHRLDAMRQLASFLAHELRTPLSAISLAAISSQQFLPDLIRDAQAHRRLPDAERRPLTKEQARALEQAPERVRRLAERSQHLISLLLINAGWNEPGATDLGTRFDLGQCVMRAVEDYPCEEAERRLIECNATAGLSVLGSPSLMASIIANLLKNALRAVHAAGHGAIRIGVRPHGEGLARVEVHDSGTGIPTEHLERIFETFVTYADDNTAMGLGLSFCKREVERIGGTLRCESEEGKYTRFLIDLPLAPTTGAAPGG